MPDHQRQHYVPKFYLKWFSSNERQINLYNWKSGKTIFNASLKEQCYRDYFYGADGADGELEGVFAALDGSISAYFKLIHEEGYLPHLLGEGHHDQMLYWIVLQTCRKRTHHFVQPDVVLLGPRSDRLYEPEVQVARHRSLIQSSKDDRDSHGLIDAPRKYKQDNDLG